MSLLPSLPSSLFKTERMHNYRPLLTLSMKSISLFLGCFLAAYNVIGQDASTLQGDNRGYTVKIGDAIPDFSLRDLDGMVHTNTSLLGTTYVLQFTASWCGVCRKEMPHLESAVWQRFKNDDFILLGVDLDEPREKVVDFALSMAITYPIAPDPNGKLFYAVAAPKSGVTRNIVVDKDGKIAFLTRLFETEEFDHMVRVIDRLLN